jgi:O-succinylbenzoate synthase
LIRLSRIALREIHLRLVDPFRTARGVVDVRRVILVELIDASGPKVWSECVAENVPGYSRESVDTCWDSLTRVIAPAALDDSFEDARDVHSRLAIIARSDTMARAAIEMGCWGIQSLQASTPIAQLLADECDSPPQHAVAAGAALGICPTLEELSARCRAARDEGYRRIRIKIERGRDTELASTALDAVNGDIPVIVDANESYSLDDIDTLRQLDHLGLAAIEQPLTRDALESLAKLQSELRTPICLDESVTNAERTQEIILRRCARTVSVKPGRVGGFAESLAIHSLCIDAEIPLWCGGMLETGIGRAYNVALASLPGFTLPGDLSPSARYWERDVITEPWVMTDGALRVPLERSGFGVDADIDFIDDITVRKIEISAS